MYETNWRTANIEDSSTFWYSCMVWFSSCARQLNWMVYYFQHRIFIICRSYYSLCFLPLILVVQFMFHSARRTSIVSKCRSLVVGHTTSNNNCFFSTLIIYNTYECLVKAAYAYWHEYMSALSQRDTEPPSHQVIEQTQALYLRCISPWLLKYK